jgi:hypothetical protein
MPIKTSIQTITPERAAEMLEMNTHNRGPSKNSVEMYAREMQAGAWKLTGESIKVAEDGTILDGQHRLMACVRAQVPFTTLVVHGIDQSAQFNMDQGQRRRAGQQLSLKGHNHSSAKAAAARILIAWESGATLGSRSPGRISVTETLELVGRWPTIEEAAVLASRFDTANRGLIIKSIVVSFLTLALAANPAKAREFAKLLESGAGMNVGHPILVLRNQCASYALQQKKLSHQDIMAWMTYAWTAFLSGCTRRGPYKRNFHVTDFPGLPGGAPPEATEHPTQQAAPVVNAGQGQDDTTPEHVSVSEAARITGRDTSTIKRWVRYELVRGWKTDPSDRSSPYLVNIADVKKVSDGAVWRNKP